MSESAGTRYFFVDEAGDPTLFDRRGKVHDVDDRRKSGFGCYYSEKNPLTAAKLKGELTEKGPGI